MPISKSGGERIRIIDKCFQDKTIKYWSYDMLFKYITNELTLDYISERSIREDIRLMKERYNAPIKKAKSRGWYYTQNDFSIYKGKYSSEDIELLQSASGLLNQFKGIRNFEEIAMLSDKIDDTILRTEAEYISLDINNRVVGLNFTDIILKGIKKNKSLKITYQPFNYDSSEELNICVYQLKEYNNRWFVLAKTLEKPGWDVGIYALDRMKSVEVSTDKYIPYPKGLIRSYFNDIIGVTNYQDKKVERIVLEVFGTQANYISTKSWHHSQKEIRKTKSSTVFELSVKINHELESLILSFGTGILVKAPIELRDKIRNKLKITLDRYN